MLLWQRIENAQACLDRELLRRLIPRISRERQRDSPDHRRRRTGGDRSCRARFRRKDFSSRRSVTRPLRKGAARLRITVTAAHEEPQIRALGGGAQPLAARTDGCRLKTRGGACAEQRRRKQRGIAVRVDRVLSRGYLQGLPQAGQVPEWNSGWRCFARASALAGSDGQRWIAYVWQALKSDNASRQVAILMVMFGLRFAGRISFIADGLYNYYILIPTGKYDLC